MLGTAILAALVFLLVLGGTPLMLSAVTGSPSAIASPTQASEVAMTPSPAFAGYNVTFSETGLTAGTSWSINLNGTTLASTTTTDVFPEVPNGTQPWSLVPVAGYSGTPTTGNVTVDGHPLHHAQTITFTSSSTTYTATFVETGLAGGTTWGVTFNGTYVVSGANGDVVIANLTDGTYAWNVSSFGGLVPTPATGSMPITGRSGFQAITFAPPPPPPGQYTAEFREFGLAGGVTWSVFYNGSWQSAVSPAAVTINGVLNGSYNFTVKPLAGYTATPASGYLNITGANAQTTIRFTALANQYTATFRETGLATGVSWSVLYNGTTQSAVAPNPIAYTGMLTGNYSFTVNAVPGYSAAPTSGFLNITAANNHTTIVFTAVTGTYSVTFQETGLTTGVTWSILYNGTTQSQTSPAPITFSGILSGTYTYSVGTVAGYSASPTSGFDNVSGASPPPVTITFTALPPGEYQVTFMESGLPASTSWTVTFNGTPASMTGNIIFNAKNGNYDYSVASVGVYTPSPASGIVTVNSASQTVPITFSQGPAKYDVSFTETGLPGGSWGVTLNGTLQTSTKSMIDFGAFLNGSYNYNISSVGRWNPNVASGIVKVDGAAQSVPISFSEGPVVYALTFTPLDLPAAQAWAVSVNNVSTPGTGVISMNEPNGSYFYSIANLTSFHFGENQGKVSIAGAVAGVTVTAHELFGVTFSETGLPTSDSWSVTFNGSSQSASAGTNLLFSAMNGSYSYTVSGPSGYSGTPASGSAQVSGNVFAQAISFSSTSGKGTGGTGNGILSGTTLWILIIVLVVIVAGVAVYALVARKKPKSGPSGPYNYSDMAMAGAGGAAVGAGASTASPPPTEEAPPAQPTSGPAPSEESPPETPAEPAPEAPPAPPAEPPKEEPAPEDDYHETPPEAPAGEDSGDAQWPPP